MTQNELRKLCGKWPGVTEDVKWGNDLVFSVGGKMFVGMPATGAATSIGFKVDDELFLAITEQPGIIPAPYAARFKWVSVVEPKRYDRKWFEQKIRRSYELVAAKLPKKKRRELGLET
jgi:predicted DNA-binding protein (MmcQ/YjbR family)